MKTLFKKLQKELQKRSNLRNLAMKIGPESEKNNAGKVGIELNNNYEVENLGLVGRKEIGNFKNKILAVENPDYSNQKNHSKNEVSGKANNFEGTEKKSNNSSLNDGNLQLIEELRLKKGRHNAKSKGRSRSKNIKYKFRRILRKITVKVANAIKKEKRRVNKNWFKKSDILSARDFRKLKQSTWKILKTLRNSKFRNTKELKKLSKILRDYMRPADFPGPDSPKPVWQNKNPKNSENSGLFDPKKSDENLQNQDETRKFGGQKENLPGMIVEEENLNFSYNNPKIEIRYLRLLKNNPLAVFRKLLLEELTDPKKVK